MSFSVIIPARLSSSRLPRKPLLDLAGIPMIVRTYLQCIKACSSDQVFVATESDEIRSVCEGYDIQVIMTSDNCLTGTDRVAECVSQLDSDYYINVQGDEPLFNPTDLGKLIETAASDPTKIYNGYTEITDESDFANPSIPKVVMASDNRLLYMSRARIPGNKSGAFKVGWRQICAYSFPKSALLDFSNFERKSVLEEIEDIEILRFLENGYSVHMLSMSGDSIAVDTEADSEKVIRVLHDRSH